MFDWLPLSDRKTLPTPRVIFAAVPWCSGALFYRTEERDEVEEFDFDRRDGDVVLLSTYFGEPEAGTIAHEHRHLQQHYLGGGCVPRLGKPLRVDFGDTPESWAKGIRLFYLRQPWEYDALRYELRVAPGERGVEQFEALIGAHQ